jgi:hypothetical protein
VGQFALRKAQAAHAPPSSLALQSVQRHKEPPESLFVLRASAHTVGHVLRNHMPHLGAMDCPMRYGALLRCFHMLVGGDLDWLPGAGGFEPLHSGNQHALVYLPDLGGNVSSLGHSGPQCCTAVMPQNDPGCVKTLRGMTAPGILRLVVTFRAKKCKNLSCARNYDQIRFRFHTTKTTTDSGSTEILHCTSADLVTAIRYAASLPMAAT